MAAPEPHIAAGLRVLAGRWFKTSVVWTRAKRGHLPAVCGREISRALSRATSPAHDPRTLVLITRHRPFPRFILASKQFAPTSARQASRHLHGACPAQRTETSSRTRTMDGHWGRRRRRPARGGNQCNSSSPQRRTTRIPESATRLNSTRSQSRAPQGSTLRLLATPHLRQHPNQRLPGSLQSPSQPRPGSRAKLRPRASPDTQPEQTRRPRVELEHHASTRSTVGPHTTARRTAGAGGRESRSAPQAQRGVRTRSASLEDHGGIDHR